MRPTIYLVVTSNRTGSSLCCEILSQLGVSTTLGTPDKHHECSEQGFAAFSRRLEDYIGRRDRKAGSAPWAVKVSHTRVADWVRATLGRETRWIVTTRNPHAQARGQMESGVSPPTLRSDLSKTAEACREATQSAIDSLAPHDPLVLDYDSVVDSPESAVTKITQFLGLERSPEEIEVAARAVDPTLRHFTAPATSTQ